jgi:ubiquinone/menaquinone biosynthesis C-methylase UbiE
MQINYDAESMRSQMRIMWNSEQHNYDHIHAHRVNSPDEAARWEQSLSIYKRGSQLLDVGVGTGFVALIAARLGFDVTGVDWSESMMSQARSKAAESDLDIRFVSGETESLPFGPDSFDLLTSRHVLWTLSEPERAFREWARVLRADGIAIADYFPRKHEGDHGHHYSEKVEKNLPLNADISPDAVAEMFRKAGFSEVSHECREIQPSHSGHVHASQNYMFICKK